MFPLDVCPVKIPQYPRPPYANDHLHCVYMSCTAFLVRALCPICGLPIQAEPIIRARDAGALRVPALAGVGDEFILRLFDLALSCTAMPTSKRPTTLKLVAELEALWMEFSGKSAKLSDKVDSAWLQHSESFSKSFDEVFDEMTEMLEEP